VDFPGVNWYRPSSWCDAMRRGASLQTRRIALVVALFLFFPPFGQRMIDCATHCQHKGTLGAHCPLRLASNADPQSTSHHCHMQRPQQSRQSELHCACGMNSPAATSHSGFTRYVLPRVAVLLPVSDGEWLRQTPVTLLFPLAFAPPDPPPRSLSV
jgi:hypothetical protein